MNQNLRLIVKEKNMFFRIERIEKTVNEIKKLIYSESTKIDTLQRKEGDYRGLEAVETADTPWEAFDRSHRWIGKNQRSWFRAKITMPPVYQGKKVVLRVITGREEQWDAINPQFLIYVNGEIIQGLDMNHQEITLTEDGKAGEEFQVDLHGFTGMVDGEIIVNLDLWVLDPQIEKVYYDLQVPLEVAKLLEEEDENRIAILNHLTEAINLLDFRKSYSKLFYEGLQKTENYLEDEFYGEYCGKTHGIAACVGHTHIDVAWLWTLKQTREKVARSFSTVLRLMEEYPEYIFNASQPQLYEFLKEDQPDLYQKVKEKIKSRVWEAEGSMWLEADCNLVSGESLVRQILHGKRFFKEEFGVDSKILWLPDVFGYSAALPQILKLCNIDYFMTTKISWNEYNKMPYDTFMWQGIDGTEILSYFITTIDYETAKSGAARTIYEGQINPSHIKGAWRRYQQKGINEVVLVSFGHGDGGGGATRKMLENARRLQKGIPGCPKLEMTNGLDFFKRLEKRVKDNKHLPKWVSELYLEYHRGTYTTMGRSKRYNRKAEFLYHDLELLAVINDVVTGKHEYPKEALRKGWKVILLNQFHDIIPGTSIEEVYQESYAQYEELFEEGKTTPNKLLDVIVSKIKNEVLSVVAMNTLGHKRDDLVYVNLEELSEHIYAVLYEGEKYPLQMIEEGKGIFYGKNMPGSGYRTYELVEEEGKRENQLIVKKDHLENSFFVIKLNEKGQITSIYDKKAQREILQSEKRANVFQAFEDKPHKWDAWDINIYYQEKMWEIDELEEIEVVAVGPVRGSLKVRYRYMDSVILQYIHIYQDLDRIDFETEIDWKETHTLLKVAFPVDVYTTKATYDIQYGNVERATHWNTSWDVARFEVCAHKWADLSEEGYGVSLLNDCKYGYDIKDSVMRLSLLKSSTWPHPTADKEKHLFIYALYPHTGNVKQGNTIEMGYQLNVPSIGKLTPPQEGNLPEAFSLVELDQRNVFIESIKEAEDDDAMIFRLYEAMQKRCFVTMKLNLNVEKAFLCNLLEENIEEVQLHNHELTFEIKPYEIKTFKVYRS